MVPEANARFTTDQAAPGVFMYRLPDLVRQYDLKGLTKLLMLWEIAYCVKTSKVRTLDVRLHDCAAYGLRDGPLGKEQGI